MSAGIFIHHYQLASEQHSSLNKTSLCQYAAAASEIPCSDTWPSVEGLGTSATKCGGHVFDDTHCIYLLCSFLTKLEVFIHLLKPVLCLHWLLSNNSREVWYNVSVIPLGSSPHCLDCSISHLKKNLIVGEEFFMSGTAVASAHRVL